MSGKRGSIIPETAKYDLCKCLELLQGIDELEFDWYTSIYTSPPLLRPRSLPAAKGLPEHKAYKAFEENQEGDDDDDDLLDLISRPAWNVGEVHITKLEMPPFWALSRYEQ